jgi:mono/diheme cytochrome c family protein/cell division protein FtsB
MMLPAVRLPTLALAFALLGDRAVAADKSVDFVRDVRPILVNNCFACHGPDDKQRKARLRFDVEDSAKKKAIVAGDADGSPLVQRVLSRDEDRMPPAETGKTLTPEQVETLKQWIKHGAKWGRHWAFEKPVRPPLPDIKLAGWPKNPIDRFVLARLEKEGLKPSQEADKYTLARRVALDLTGLPPDPELVKKFIADSSPEAYERLVDELLKSPAYGERWARMWLDLARYADTKGYEKDLARTMWRYRDWVIEAFNADMPYNQFTRDQLAGDLLPDPTVNQLLATAFHRNTMVNEEGGTDDEEFRVAAVKDRVDTTVQVWMGLTMGCAKCHSHKYDPIAQKEYYQFYAFFNQTEDADLGDERPKIPTPTLQQQEQIAKLQAEYMKVRQEIYTYTDEFKTAAAKWEEVARTRTGWTVVKPKEMTAASGSTMKLNDDGSVLVEARKPARETYVVTVPAGTKPITGIKLEVLPDRSLPRNGVGRSENDGNFVLSRFVVKAKDRTLPIASAVADFAQQNYPIEHAIKNPDPKKHGWAVAPKQQQIHEAAFILAEPYKPADSTDLEITLDHQFEFTYPGFSIGRFRIHLTSDDSPTLSGELPAEVKGILAVPPDRRTAEQQAYVWAYYAGIAPSKKALRDKLDDIQKQIAAVPVPHTPIMKELPPSKRRSNKVHVRGNFLDQGEIVEPNTPSSFHPFPPDAPKNRLGVAEWLMHPDNPLTARVAVNRFWAHFFGRGLVETQEDFGSQGQPPTHPELLDWLAIEFRERGWSMKRLCKTIVMSSTYRQSSHIADWRLAIADLKDNRQSPIDNRHSRDANNRLLARGPRFRMEAEMIRDVSLAASGLLSKKMFGPSVMPPQPDGLWKSAYSGEKWITATGEDRYRRGLYTFIKRTAPYPAMTTFDSPSREICTVRRVPTNTPLQALVTLNDTSFVEMAQALARKMHAAGKTTDDRIAHGLLRALVRPAKAEEVAVLKELYAARLKHYEVNPDEAKKLATDPLGPAPDGMNVIELAALTAVANVILNLDEFLMRN